MKKLLIWLTLALLLVNLALALPKPLAGQVIGSTGQVKLFVEVDFLGQSQLCTVSPPVETGPEGAFATNLANLIFQNFPQMKCDSFWQAGDKVWYVFGSNQSEIEKIESGTGVQFLKSLTVAVPAVPPTTPSTGGGGGGGGSRPPQEPVIETPAIIAQPSLSQPEISLNLTGQPTEKFIEALLAVQLLNRVQKDLSVKIILSEFFNEKIMQTQTDKFFLPDSFEKNYVFDLASLPLGQYKLQAFIYDREKLIGVSNIIKFTLAAPETQELIEIPAPLAEKFAYSEYWYLLLILAVVFIALLIWRLKKK